MKWQRSRLRWAAYAAATGLALLVGCTAGERPPSPDLSRTPTLYVVASAHLDSQWNWTYAETIARFLPRTLRANFALLHKYPRYVFNFSGANRYRLIKEYYPREFETLKRFVAAGRWFPAGSSLEECDANIPAPESLIRQVLYGNQFFRREFNKSSAEFMLPDSFGFPASLPSILAHCGLKGFSTQKLYMGSSAMTGATGPWPGIPFNVGYWQGVDGRGVIAALNPGRYRSSLWYDLSRSPVDSGADPAARSGPVDWPARVRRNGEASGLFADYMYFGSGDKGGAPDEASVRLLEAIVDRENTILPQPPKRLVGARPADGRTVRVGTGPLHVVSATAEQMFLDIRPAQAERLPRYRGELQLSNHSAGVLTSQAYVKRWNRRAEVLADAAERAAVIAGWLTGREYPQQRLNEAWGLALAAQFHDILAGTSSPEAYRYTWNDQVLAMNQFALVLTSSLEAISALLDTRTTGVPVVVYNALDFEREDVVEAALAFPGGRPRAVRVRDAAGSEVPAQLNAAGKVVFLARVPALGCAVFDVQPAVVPAMTQRGELRASPRELENHRYHVRFNEQGDVAGITDKSSSRELLSAPLHLEIKTDDPQHWPAWNMDWADQQRPPRSWVAGPATVRVRESGPARVAVEIERRCEGSRFVQVVRLAAGDAGERLEFASIVEWRTRAAHLKAVFPLAAANPRATYSLGVGTLERGNNEERKFEVSSQQWFDLTDASGAFGVSVLSGSKYGSDKPDDRTLRLTLIRTPGSQGGFPDQASQDLGRHEFVFGLAAHQGDWRRGRTDRHAYRLDQPLMAFQAQRHDGHLGKIFSFLGLGSGARLLALKKAEESDETVVRIVESDGRGVPDLRLRFAARIESAREVDGQELPLGEARVVNGELRTTLGPWQLRAFALTFAAADVKNPGTSWRKVPLVCDAHVAGRNGERNAGGFDGLGSMLPAEFLPRRIACLGVELELADPGISAANAVRCSGQTLRLPPGDFSRLLILAAAAGDQEAAFTIGGSVQRLLIQDWRGRIGQWDNRLWRDARVSTASGGAHGQPAAARKPARAMAGLEPGFIKDSPVAWHASHHHDAAGADVPYAYSYLFLHELRVPPGAGTITLPRNGKIRILAMTAVGPDLSLRPLQPLLDALPGDRP